MHKLCGPAHHADVRGLTFGIEQNHVAVARLVHLLTVLRKVPQQRLCVLSGPVCELRQHQPALRKHIAHERKARHGARVLLP